MVCQAANKKGKIMARLRVEQYVVGEVMTNCYFAVNEDTMEALVIDPGDGAKQLAGKIRDKSLIPRAVLLTHGHFDHVMACLFSPDAQPAA